MRFSGSQLFVNADVAGEIKIEVLDQAGRVLAGYGAERCVAVKGNGTRMPVAWSGSPLAALAGETVRFRFRIDRGRLYSFWVSATPSGASGGYVGAGGPGFRDAVDRP